MIHLDSVHPLGPLSPLSPLSPLGSSGPSGSSGSSGSSGPSGPSGPSGRPGLPARIGRHTLAIAAVLLLHACGGGGSDTVTPPSAQVTPESARNSQLPASDAGGALPPADVAPSAPPAEGWIRVSAPVTLAQPNASYQIDAPDSTPVTLTLPPDPRPGDTLKVQGLGAGRWRLAQSAQQEVITSALPGIAWREVGPAALDQPWWAVAASGDGSTLMAASNPGQLYLSHDGGNTWQQRLHTAHWSALAISLDGQHMVATAFGERIWVSHDAGLNWLETGEVRDWVAATISKDGQRVAADGKSDRIHVSSNGGLTWSAHTQVANWQSVAASGDGLRLIAAVGGGSVWLSDEGGLQWRTSNAGERAWYRVGSSSDGQQLSASDSGGYLYISHDRGATWTPQFREGPVNFISYSGDARQLVIDVPHTQTILPDGQIHFSTDLGQTWGALENNRIWRGLSLSSDGRVLLAADHEGRLHLSRGHRTRHGESGAITGGQGDRVDLEYLGAGVWRVRAAQGSGFAVE